MNGVGTVPGAVKAKIEDAIRQLQEVDDVVTNLGRMVIDLKYANLQGEPMLQLQRAITNVVALQRETTDAIVQLGKVLEPPKDMKAKREEVEQVTEGMNEISQVGPLLVSQGYARDMSAPGNEVWYAHPAGHIVRAAKKGAHGIRWEYFPPRMIGETRKGIGFLPLKQQVNELHPKPLGEGRDGNDYDPYSRSKEAENAFNTSFRDFFIRQTEAAPVERYEVWEAGQKYPHLVARFPVTGEWKDYTYEANLNSTSLPEGQVPSKYIEIARYWVNRGKPLLKSGSDELGSQPTVNALGAATLPSEGW